MISYIQGKLVKKTPAYIIVESNGIGFRLWIPLSSFKVLGEVGDEIKILTYLHVREDVLQLFGFATNDERELFQLLISVSGIGPRLAQGILSGISVNDFKRAIKDRNNAILTTAPGVGKKTAERLILELSEKIGEVKKDEVGVPISRMTPIEEESVLALVSLGYKRFKAQAVVQEVLRENGSLSLEELLRQALRRI